MNAQPLPETALLTLQGDLAAQMVAGIDRYLMREIEAAAANRSRFWKRDLSSEANYRASIAANRESLRRRLGVSEARPAPSLTYATTPLEGKPASCAGKGKTYAIHRVRWSVMPGIETEGLLLEPARKRVGAFVALLDADETPEQGVGLVPSVPAAQQFARRLAENGFRVLIPTLINRKPDFTESGTNQPHREYIWRVAYVMGRTMIGYEAESVLAAADWLQQSGDAVGVFGYGEGGLLALYASALRPFHLTVVSGYFGPRETLWSEPIYRNVFGLLMEFGDAEIASLIYPQPLLIEASAHPAVGGPPQIPGRGGAAPGAIRTPDLEAVRREFERFRALVGYPDASRAALIVPARAENSGPGQEETLRACLKRFAPQRRLKPEGALPTPTTLAVDTELRQKRLFRQIVAHTQWLMQESPKRRAEFWQQADASGVSQWQETTRVYRDMLWNNLIGRLPKPTSPLNPRTRPVYDTPKFTGYEVVLDVYPDVFAYGILLVPKGITPGERRAVVVCQHGLEGRPQDVADPGVDSPYYHQFACKLAEEGYITFAPQNPYIGEDRFRVLLRKAQPLGWTLFSFITRQHERILDWLETVPFVDAKRMAFYGLSYGGKTAMRVPAVLERYCLSICSADYNEWVWKNASAESRYSYLRTGEYDMPEWNLANTFNYAEMSWLICPRPFMVERGHDDGVAPDEWVAYEYARTRRHYVRLGIGDRTEIEFFDGPHTIHGVGTFAFLRKYLGKP